jgi:hypothetical protein
MDAINAKLFVFIGVLSRLTIWDLILNRGVRALRFRPNFVDSRGIFCSVFARHAVTPKLFGVVGLNSKLFAS